ncbi:hypothetical protein Y032_0760g2122 [Ancylostoma ceylanicum]|uniref:Uncharacterized protein n=1 Tax=Ancylostoma ceylanicum TaxID=53326 RepID=A0A016WE30_9BILA|nr:hypothetical protein Y032_0760g2122 [Ancylostoma ceylanicum]
MLLNTLHLSADHNHLLIDRLQDYPLSGKVIQLFQRTAHSMHQSPQIVHPGRFPHQFHHPGLIHRPVLKF